MKQKAKKSTPSFPSDLKSIIHEQSLFFDNLVELIPARFYLPVDDKNKPWFQGLSKIAKASFKKETRENIKKSRRARLDPDNSSTTTLDLLKQSLQNEKVAADEDSNVVQLQNSIEDDRSVTYEELRQRLHRRIAELRGNLPEKDKDAKGERKDHSQKKDKKKKRDSLKRKRGVESEETNIAEAAPKSDAAFAFGRVKIENEGQHVGKKRKLTKVHALEKAKKLEEAKKDPVVSRKHSWQAAASRAAGVKVHDNPKILKQSIKKEKKKKEKSAEKWKERMESRDKARAEKQQTRAENIAGRIQEKKARKIAKREKKLMRPGFEGRKEGFINEP